MKLIKVPADITLVDPITGARMRDPNGEAPPVSFREHAIRQWLNDARMAETRVDAARLASVILPAFLAAKPGGVVRLEDADHAKLVPVVETARPYGPLAAIQLLPFADAVVNATNEATNGISAHDAGESEPHRRGEAHQ